MDDGSSRKRNSENVINPSKQLFACLAVIGCSRWVSARPDVSLGYRYSAGFNSGSSGGALLTAPLTTTSTSTSYQPTASGNTYYNTIPSIGQVNVGSAGFVPSTQVISSSGGGGGGAGSQITQSYTSSGNSDSIGLTGLKTGPNINYGEQEAYLSHLVNFQPAVVSKHFYIHTAPEDHDEQQIVRHVTIGRPQKNYRVVFINAPSSSASKAKIIANVAPVEDKTAIYVLSKKSNALDVSAEVVTPAPVNNKPEVFFIKYKTPQEAQHAQQTIQAQYDSLGGSSQVSDEGLVPVSSVIGSLGDNGASGVIADGNGGVNIIGTGGIPVNAGGSDSGSGSSTSSVQIIGGNTGGYDAAGSGISQLGYKVVQHTGDNTQATYLPVAQK
ncbi:uncharacterized protein LOC115629188 [Scaptodrosophila lebanonensis]|uniref:Uncharacterized protein LOC115629188 n=1 Tax=Drosophila lebanonensis TaxID=7225 RepID=A0A6J2U1U4_DROLE|nr:uncharacterized protein LOC115629188 [Scaptodrosophila lebanonensis]